MQSATNYPAIPVHWLPAQKYPKETWRSSKIIRIFVPTICCNKYTVFWPFPLRLSAMSKDQNDDEILGKAIDISLLRRLTRFLQPYKLYVFVAVFFTLVVSVLVPLRPYLTKVAVDDNIAHKDWNGLLSTLMLILGILVLQGGINYGLSLLMQWVGQQAVYDLRMQLFSRLQKLSLRFYDTNPIGRLVTRVTSDVEILNEVFSSGLVVIISDILVIVGIVAFMLTISWELTLLTIAILPLLLIATALFRKKVRANYRDIRKQVARLNAFLNEYISGIGIIQLFQQERSQHEKFEHINRAHADTQIRTIFYYAIFFPVVEMLAGIATAIMLWYAAGGIMSGTMTVGMLIAFTQYFEMFFRPIRELSEKYDTLQNAMASSERIFVLLDENSFVEDAPNAEPMQQLEKGIEFQNVWFGYTPTAMVLKDVSFAVNKGETVAIVGATGAGKSSIINLLTRFYEFQQGAILVDGKDIRRIQQQSLRSRIALVLQDVFLFSGSISRNISLGNEEISQEAIEQAAKAVGAHTFIQRLPQGYNTPVMERGATLSVGQKQLISFARALAANPDILILDEATSSVDTATEHLIEQAIQTLMVGRTSIVIAHRLSTIQRADRIIVLHHGEVREQGNHHQLLAQNGLYAKLYRLQYKEQFASNGNGVASLPDTTTSAS